MIGKNENLLFVYVGAAIVLIFPVLAHWTEVPHPDFLALLAEGLYELIKVAFTAIFAAILIRRIQTIAVKESDNLEDS